MSQQLLFIFTGKLISHSNHSLGVASESPTANSDFDITQFQLYRGFDEFCRYITEEAATTRIAGTQVYLYTHGHV